MMLLHLMRRSLLKWNKSSFLLEYYSLNEHYGLKVVLICNAHMNMHVSSCARCDLLCLGSSFSIEGMEWLLRISSPIKGSQPFAVEFKSFDLTTGLGTLHLIEQ